jgi:hypothetical protein
LIPAWRCYWKASPFIDDLTASVPTLGGLYAQASLKKRNSDDHFDRPFSFMAVKVPHLISAAFQTFNVQGSSNCV